MPKHLNTQTTIEINNYQDLSGKVILKTDGLVSPVKAKQVNVYDEIYDDMIRMTRE